MDIVDNSSLDQLVEFKEILRGSCFLFDGDLFLKTDEGRTAIRLQSGRCDHFGSRQLVRPVNAEAHYTTL